MTRRLAAAALVAGTLGLAAVPANAGHDSTVCVGGDTKPGRITAVCVNDPASAVKVSEIRELGDILPPPP